MNSLDDAYEAQMRQRREREQRQADRAEAERQEWLGKTTTLEALTRAVRSDLGRWVSSMRSERFPRPDIDYARSSRWYALDGGKLWVVIGNATSSPDERTTRIDHYGLVVDKKGRLRVHPTYGSRSHETYSGSRCHYVQPHDPGARVPWTPVETRAGLAGILATRGVALR